MSDDDARLFEQFLSEPHSPSAQTMDRAHAKVRGRLRRRRARHWGAMGVAASVAILLAVVALTPGRSRNSSEIAASVASSGGSSDVQSPGAPLNPGQSLDPDSRVPGVECGEVPVEAETIGLRFELPSDIRRSAPRSNRGERLPVTVSNLKTTSVRLQATDGLPLVLIAEDGSIASAGSPLAVASSIDVLGSEEVEAEGWLPFRSCGQGAGELLTPGNYTIAAVAPATTSDGTTTLVRSGLVVLTYT